MGQIASVPGAELWLHYLRVIQERIATGGMSAETATGPYALAHAFKVNPLVSRGQICTEFIHSCCSWYPQRASSRPCTDVKGLAVLVVTDGEHIWWLVAKLLTCCLMCVCAELHRANRPSTCWSSPPCWREGTHGGCLWFAPMVVSMPVG